MAIYAIGDVQGCYDELCRLLDKINFNETRDTLWLVGDLVSRGPDSLQTLRFVKSLGASAVTVLGNHDLHLLALSHGVKKARNSSSLRAVLKSPDCEELLKWLQARPLLHYDDTHKALLVHAGIHPAWNLRKATKLAGEVEKALRGKQADRFFRKMYGNKPRRWSNKLKGAKRLRCITNIFTRMRYFDGVSKLDFDANGSPRKQASKGLTPWFELESALEPDIRVLFGHWSTLPVGCYGRYFALDGGCVWGGHLVALRIDFESEDWVFVDSYTRKPINSAK